LLTVVLNCVVICQLCSLKDDQLQKLGLTSGACKKFLTSIELR